MSSPHTEQLPTVGTGAGRVRLPLVPALCGAVIAASWLAACLVIILPQ